jgi:hypothetical protein
MREFKSRVEENGEDQDGDPWATRVCRGNVGQLVTLVLVVLGAWPFQTWKHVILLIYLNYVQGRTPRISLRMKAKHGRNKTPAWMKTEMPK